MNDNFEIRPELEFPDVTPHHLFWYPYQSIRYRNLDLTSEPGRETEIRRCLKN